MLRFLAIDPRVSEQPGPPIVLEHRLGQLPPGASALMLPLGADQRTSLRGHRRSACGCDLLLQLPRGAALEPGEALADALNRALVVVVAAAEPLLLVRSPDPLALLQAAYHLGNRHVAMELRPDQLRILQDPVLDTLLRQRGLSVEPITAPFLPEAGAYTGSGHHHGH
ncbi:urease accessory protein UreE [Synechococcus sp. Tobar12-5m-g]|nr:urease accessory protein UreE [Synechococcus sp. Tobar12-5m-g]MCP9872910.1 urease accessory protein UreE [Synechococcus sp. Cruz CV-v-12]